VQVPSLLNVTERDPDDNKFIECAVDGRCGYGISKDRHLLDLKQYNKIQIVTVDEFLQALNTP
jgi:predicted nucleic acid-binding protein